MNDLLPYYESELRFIREMGTEFARAHPEVAERLALEENECRDPHVERLIEAFALLAGRIRHKLDDEFPEISESLLNILYPHYLQPVPSMAIAQFALDATQSSSTGGHSVERHSEIRTHPLAEFGTHCSFRTCYPLKLWPLEVTDASILSPGMFPPGIRAERAVAAIRIELQCQSGVPLVGMGLDELRFCLDGDDAVTHTLYELIFNNTLSVALVDRPARKRSTSALFGSDCIRPVGFDRDEEMLPYPDRSFPGYRLLQEYFSFPRKFLFFDVRGFKHLPLASFGERIELILLLKEFEGRERLAALQQGVRAETFRLGCVPIINLFPKSAEPIRLTHTRTEYHVIPDVHLPNATEVYSVKRVASTGGYHGQGKIYEPFYSLRHSYDEKAPRAYWYASRRASPRDGDNGTEVYLSLVDPDFHPTHPADEALSVHTICTNRDVPAKLQLRYTFGELWMELRPMLRIRFLHKPTTPLRLPLRSSLQWRLISHLALNHLSLGGNGISDQRSAEALREILRLYNFANDPGVRKQVDGIASVSSRPHLAPVTAPEGIAFVLGLRAEIEFDEQQYPSGGVFLLASVLERFLGLYSALNSFTQLTAFVRSSGRKEVLRQWKARAGEQILL